MPNSARKPTAEYLSGPRIPGAIRWDLDRIANPQTDSGSSAGNQEPDAWKASGLAMNELGLGHMLPGPRRFAEACCKGSLCYGIWLALMLVFLIAKLGIKPTDHVVVYDSLGIFSAPRGAFTFTVSRHATLSSVSGKKSLSTCFLGDEP
jgi:thiosulfate/3-mercaptopyruvate sulfurtransferase